MKEEIKYKIGRFLYQDIKDIKLRKQYVIWLIAIVFFIISGNFMLSAISRTNKDIETRLVIPQASIKAPEQEVFTPEDTTEFTNKIPKDRQITPKELFDLLNSFKESYGKIDMKAIYQNLGVEPSYWSHYLYYPADILETDIGGNQDKETIVVISDGVGLTWDYLIFTKDNTNGYRFLEHLGFNPKYAPPQHSIVSIGSGGPWLVIKYLDENSFGIGIWHAWESWYFMDGNKIKEVLKRLDYAKSSFWPYPWNVVYKSNRILQKEFNDTYLIDYLMDVSYTQNISGSNQDKDLFSKKEKVRYYWNNDRKEFLIDKSVSRETEEQIIFVAEEDEFLKHNFKELFNLAEKGTDTQKEWLRLFLKDCEDSQEKEFLSFLPSIKTGKIKIDKQEMAGIQGAIDDGHQPWRTDPKEIACIDSTQYGFILEENYKTIKEVYHLADIPGIIKYQVVHAGKDYIITVVQPVPGEGKIWTISEISEKSEWIFATNPNISSEDLVIYYGVLRRFSTSGEMGFNYYDIKNNKIIDKPCYWFWATKDEGSFVDFVYKYGDSVFKIIGKRLEDDNGYYSEHEDCKKADPLHNINVEKIEVYKESYK